VRINTNIPSLQAQRRLQDTTRAFARSLQRLASGKRINRAGDDASGLAISEGLNAQIRGMRQATRNINDAFGFLNTAESAIQIQTDLLQRIRELAIQASNGAIGNQERSFLQTEVSELMSEFSRLASQTEFNGLKLINGDFETSSIQVGAHKSNTINIELASTRAEELFQKTVGTLEFNGIIESSIPTGGATQVITAGDLNNDGSLDYILGRSQSEFAGIYLGDGNGGFTHTQTVDMNLRTVTNALADFNGDGILDYVQKGNLPSPAISVSLGVGDGTFQSSTTLAAGIGQGSLIKTGDVDGDGDQDIVYVAEGDERFDVYINDGSGNFSEAITSAAPEGPRGLTLGDFNGDGILDAATADLNGFLGENISVYLGQGDGRFGNRVTYAVDGSDPVQIEAADIDNDGDIDIVANAQSNDLINVLLNDGYGNFSKSSFMSINGARFRLADINSDGVLDIALESSADEELGYQLGNGDGSFQSLVTISVSFDLSQGTIVADFTNDGIVDILTASVTPRTNYLLVQDSIEVSAAGDIDVSTQQSAQNSLELLDSAIDELVSRRSTLGAQSNRLRSALNNSLITVENLEAAKSQILDADMAQETADLTKNQILQQASVSVLGQANVNLQIVLELLRGVS
jgi:flagellin